MPIISPAFMTGLQAGLIAPVGVFAPPPSYAVNAATFAPSFAFAQVGDGLTQAMRRHANHGRSEQG